VSIFVNAAILRFQQKLKVKEAQKLIVHSLKLIPSKNLPESYQTLLAKFDTREAESLYTLKDFPMPSRVLRQEGSTIKGPSSPLERLNSSPLDDVQIEEISTPTLMTPSILEQKLTTATATLANEEERNLTSVLKQKIKIDESFKQNQPQPSIPSDEEDQGFTRASNVEQNMDSDEGFKLPSTLTCRVREGGSENIHRDVERDEVAHATKATAVKHERWTYQLLVECKPLIKFFAEVMQAFGGLFREFYCHITQPHTVEWCIMVDNSGSMLAKDKES